MSERFSKSKDQVLIGAGLRSTHFPDLLEQSSATIQWFEIITENFLTTQGRPRRILEKIRQDYPIAVHGVSLSIGSPEDLNFDYLKKLKQFISELDPFIVSDHFCWTGLQNNNAHNLLPMTFSRSTLEALVLRIQAVQDFLGQRLILENASAYLQMKDDVIPEWEFIGEVCKRSGCGILLDLNNLYVTASNLGRDPLSEFNQIPKEFVQQIHLAGHTDMGTHLFDTHSKPVQDPVWSLYDLWLETEIDPIPTMIEWDDDIPPLAVLEAEVNKIRHHRNVSKQKLLRMQNHEL